jgi:hypothetical protein
VLLRKHNGSHEPVVSQTKHKNQSHFDRRLSPVSPARTQQTAAVFLSEDRGGFVVPVEQVSNLLVSFRPE